MSDTDSVDDDIRPVDDSVDDGIPRRPSFDTNRSLGDESFLGIGMHTGESIPEVVSREMVQSMMESGR